MKRIKPPTVPAGVVNMVQYLVVTNKGDHKPLNVGTMLLITETKVPLGRVDGYFFGSVTNPDYIVKVEDSEMQIPEVRQGGPSGSFGVDLSYPNQQQLGSEMDFNPQTQPTMQSQLFNAGPYSYRESRESRTIVPAPRSTIYEANKKPYSSFSRNAKEDDRNDGEAQGTMTNAVHRSEAIQPTLLPGPNQTVGDDDQHCLE
ncbi:hypothetical protein ISN44_As04g003900 [Arabidopsis suecica]|uniref:Uncharacterized protein n=1 Tax=Arabidopsis suecica TaxID=45249 RepID=A0A8T2E991_ARASU|nr:hypothetical protein ISN44_As04g003900 [Arabidopsis suecica]